MDVVVWLPGCGEAGEDGVPDYGFGGGFVGARRGVHGFNVKEHLLGIPVEKGAQI